MRGRGQGLPGGQAQGGGGAGARGTVGAGARGGGRGAEEAAGDVVELDADFGLVLVEALAAAQDEGDAVPALVAHVDSGHGEGGGAAGRGHGGVAAVAGARAVRAGPVLAEDNVAGGEGRDGAQDLDLFAAHVLGGAQGRGPVHGHDAEHLEQVVLHHVPDDAVLVKVPPAPLNPNRLLEDNLDAVDAAPVPHRVEEHVCKAQDQHVLDHLLAQVVVDAVDFVLGKEGRQGCAQGRGAGRVPAKGLFNHQPVLGARLVVQVRVDALADGDKDCRWQCQVEDSQWFA